MKYPKWSRIVSLWKIHWYRKKRKRRERVIERGSREEISFTASRRGPTSGAVSCPAPLSWALGGHHGWVWVPGVEQVLPRVQGVLSNSRAIGAGNYMGQVLRHRRHRLIIIHVPRLFLLRRTCGKFWRRNPYHVPGLNLRSPIMDRELFTFSSLFSAIIYSEHFFFFDTNLYSEHFFTTNL